MAEPTQEQLTAALSKARKMLSANPDWDVIRALAEATAAVDGVASFKVFRDVRSTVEEVIGGPLPEFAATATRSKQIEVLHTAHLVVMS